MVLKDKELKELLAEFKEGLRSLYQSRLKGIYLYGSYARDNPEEDSDIDVLIVLDEIEHYAGEIDRTGYLTSDLSLKYGATISRVLVTERDWKSKNTSFFVNVREDAIAA